MSIYQTRLATVQDVFKIMQLYQEVYQGSYPEPLMRNVSLMEKFLQNPSHFWFVADVDGRLVGSVIIRHDDENRIAKAGAAVVVSEFRKIGLMEALLGYGIEYVKNQTSGVDIVYATTRTVHEGAQALTEKLGFKKLGIFPNAHKSVEVETHCLTAWISKEAMQSRQSRYYLHHRLRDLAVLVAQEFSEITPPETIEPKAPTRMLVDPPILEIIDSEHFVRHRFQSLKREQKLQFTFFPFHEPNLLIVSPDQTTEVFCFHSKEDGHTVIIGGKAPDNVDYAQFLNRAAQLLRDHHARYIEILIRADKPKIIESVLRAKFIPSAFFPAFQLQKLDGQEVRHDYIVMSRTFEIFDFQNIRLKGLNQKYLEYYYDQWKQSSLNPFLLQPLHNKNPRDDSSRGLSVSHSIEN